MAKGRLTRGIVAGAIYGGAKAYTDELDYQQKVADEQARQDRAFKQQDAMQSARDEASFKRQQQVADFQQAKIDAQQAKLAAAMKSGAAAAREQGIDPSSAAGLRFVASALGDAGLASDAERYTNRATDMQRADDAYARQEAAAKTEAEKLRIQEQRDNLRYNAMMAGITARGARGDGSDKDIPIGKYMRDVEGDVKDAFNLKRPSKLGDKQEEMNYGVEGVTLFHKMYDNAIKHDKSQREAVDIARDYALQNASFVRAAYRAGKPADEVFNIGIAAHDDAVAKANAAAAGAAKASTDAGAATTKTAPTVQRGAEGSWDVVPATASTRTDLSEEDKADRVKDAVLAAKRQASGAVPASVQQNLNAVVEQQRAAAAAQPVTAPAAVATVKQGTYPDGYTASAEYKAAHPSEFAPKPAPVATPSGGILGLSARSGTGPMADMFKR